MGYDIEKNVASTILEEYKKGKIVKMFYSYKVGYEVNIYDLTEDDIKQNLIYYMCKQGSSEIFKTYTYILSDILLNLRKNKLLKIKERINGSKH
jgi:major membrane immunogen (membrane-anchored lipoprotein)